MTKTFTFRSDAGHGWIECFVSLLDELGIKSKISHYSYLRGNIAYLEEDCDAALLVNALESKGFEVEFTDKIHDGRCFIRNLQRFENK